MQKNRSIELISQKLDNKSSKEIAFTLLQINIVRAFTGLNQRELVTLQHSTSLLFFIAIM